MSLYTKVGGALKQVQSLPVMINGEIKDISTLYSKKDGAIVVVFSSGAIIEFSEYNMPIPVASGWQYSTDGKTWTTVSEDGEINGPKGPYYDFSEAYLDWNNGLYLRGIGVVDETNVDYVLVNYSLMDGSDVVSTSENTSDDFELDIGTEGICLLDGPISGTYDDPHFVWNSVAVYDTSGNVVWTYTPGSTFTGYVKAKGELSLTDYYNRTGVGDTPVNVGLRKDGTALSTARYYPCSFVNGGKGYVCGGTTGSASAVVNTYDESGTRATGTALSTARWGSMSFVNGDYGFVCGGRTASSTASAVTDLYNSSGTRTTGTALSDDRAYGTGFTHGDYGYVAGGIRSSVMYRSYVERYSTSGTRSTGTALGGSRAYLTSFVLGDYAYVCGGQSSNFTYQSTVYKYNTSGSMTTGTSLSITRSMLTSFVNGDKGYVCGGYTGSAKTNVDVYNTSGTMTTGTALSVARYEMSSFVLDGYGFVCGGNGSSNVVDVYDTSGTRTTGNTLNTGRSRSTAFAVGDYGFVCGGYTSSATAVVDQYYHEYETLYFADIPVTEGSTYTLNSESGTADVSEVMTIQCDSTGVTGTIKYKKGDLLPGVQITVVDASGNVVEGAEISFITNDWDLSGLTLTWSGDYENSQEGGPITLTISGITGNFPECAKCGLVPSSDPTSTYYLLDITDNNPNVSRSQNFGRVYNFESVFVLLDTDGNVIAETAEYTTVDNLV